MKTERKSTDDPSAGDSRQLYDLQAELAAEQVYHSNEVEQFAKVFFKPKDRQSPNDHAQMHRILDFPVERFGQLEPEKQELFRAQLAAFRNLYAFLSQIIPFQDTDLEKLYTFIRLLIPRLPKRSIGPGLVFDDEVNLKYYRLQKTSEGSISLAPGDRGASKHQPRWGRAKTVTSRSNSLGSSIS